MQQTMYLHSRVRLNCCSDEKDDVMRTKDDMFAKPKETKISTGATSARYGTRYLNRSNDISAEDITLDANDMTLLVGFSAQPKPLTR